jgi:dihydroxyacetone kinase
MEMAGCSISLLDLDAEIETLLGAPTACPFWPR